MIAARARAVVITLSVVLFVGAALALGAKSRQAPPARPEAQRPTLLLLTSLPLMFGEDFSLKGGGSTALQRLQARYRVRPISVSSASELAHGRLLMMAQPLAQTPENLVALDDWVRGGGRVLVLADPMLEWPSKRPLGDLLRPPPMFMDTGLLAHWGLKLDAPEQRGPAKRTLGGYDQLTMSPGSLIGTCKISGDRLVAQCRVGKGRATVVADADLLNVQALGGAAGHNLDGVMEELAGLES
ncbi:hypothetical protein [Sphingomonas sp.]|uniref:hypothetical protein n=1 Tax=Sphingomonas sp. TaxID=28214 RepID=UPI0038AD49C9